VNTIAFTVPGNPVPQPRARISTHGGFARAYVPSRHPVHAYREAIALHAKAAGLRQTSDTLLVDIVAVFERPKSHRTRKGLKSDAPKLPRPDVDNIAKAVLDALGDSFDDTNVMRLSVAKSYGDEAMTMVRIADVAHENA
jgi:Holliday junction resolvase RusA-like endonuclease